MKGRRSVNMDLRCWIINIKTATGMLNAVAIPCRIAPVHR